MTRYEVTWQKRIWYRAYVEAESLDEAMEVRDCSAIEIVNVTQTNGQGRVVEEQA